MTGRAQARAVARAAWTAAVAAGNLAEHLHLIPRPCKCDWTPVTTARPVHYLRTSTHPGCPLAVHQLATPAEQAA